jgi:hypothetical protein
VRAGEDIQLSAEVDDSVGQPIGGADISFLSNNPSLLVVSRTGLVQSVGPAGRAKVQVSGGGKQAAAVVTVSAGPASLLEVHGGDGQSAAVGGALAHPVVARVLDGKSNPVSGADVVFTSQEGARVDPSEAMTNASGEASARWTLGPEAGTQILIASLRESKVPPAHFSAEAESGPPAKLAAVGEPFATVIRGASRDLMVRVTDEHGNAKEGVSIRWRVEAGGGQLSTEESISDQSGIARARFSSGKKARVNRVVASSGQLATQVDIAAE